MSIMKQVLIKGLMVISLWCCMSFECMAGKDPESKGLRVIVFLGTECPLSINYTLTLNTLHDKYADQQVEFIGVFSFEDDDTEEIEAFVEKYQIKFEVKKDRLYAIADSLQAKITPVVFLISSTGEIIYSGKIDNWPIALGKKRTVITEHYLDDAIKNYLEGKPVPINRTEAVGCFIHAHVTHDN